MSFMLLFFANDVIVYIINMATTANFDLAIKLPP